MKKSLVLFLLLLVGFNADAEQGVKPHKMVQKVANATFERIRADKKLIDKDHAHIKRVLKEELMPHVDHILAAKLLLDRTPATNEQKVAFYRAFEQYLLTTYAAVFEKYSNEKLVVESDGDASGKVATVKAKLLQADKPPIPIDFKVRLTDENSWLLFDMVVEGISLLNSKRAEFRAILRQNNGVETATALMIEKANSSR